MVAISIVCGALTGLLGFLPLYLGLHLRKKMISAPLAVSTVMLLTCLFISCIILVLLTVAFLGYYKSGALPFAIATAVSLSVTAVVYGISKNKRERKRSIR